MIQSYLRAAIGGLPGNGLIPVVGRVGGADVPDRTLTKTVTADPQHLARYAEVCGFAEPGDALPLTYPHVLAFGMQMELMTDRRFPVPALGLVHIENRITQHRDIAPSEALDLTVRATPLQPHAKGRAFSLVTEARAGGELVWEEVSTNLARGKGDPSAARERVAPPELTEREAWDVPEDLGRRYGGASGDRNPIHLHAVTAKLFGFPRAIAHGMWTKARAVAALDVSGSATVDVQFVKPLLLPGRAQLAVSADERAFAVRSPDASAVHLSGTVE